MRAQATRVLPIAKYGLAFYVGATIYAVLPYTSPFSAPMSAGAAFIYALLGIQ